MSSIGVGARRDAMNTDYDAAQALLDLQSNTNPESSAGNYAAGWRDMENKEDIEKAAKLILSCFITSDVPEKNNLVSAVGKMNTNYPITSNVLLNSTENNRSRIIEPRKTYPKYHQRNIGKTSFLNSQSLNIKTDRKINIQTEVIQFCDAGTQTEEQYPNPNILLMETTIKNLCDRIKTLEAQLKPLDRSIDEASLEQVDRDLDFSYESNDHDPDFEMTMDDTVTTNESKYSRTSELDSSSYNDSRSRSRQTNKKVIYSGILTNHNTNSLDTVPIGDGNATVPSRLLKQINWNSYSSATRKLLTAVFSRRILATHSLTGKPSPAFPNKPAKKRLDPILVNDIVQTVVERCRVPENVVRTSITTKCADESKMFRTREKNKKKQSNKFNRENVSPASSDSESGDY